MVRHDPTGTQVTPESVGFCVVTECSSAIQRAKPFWLRQPDCVGVTYPYNVKCSDSLPYKIGQVATGTHTTFGLRNLRYLLALDNKDSSLLGDNNLRLY